MAVAGEGSGRVANGRALSYIPYQSHRRTASLRSNNSTSNNSSVTPNSPRVSSPLVEPSLRLSYVPEAAQVTITTPAPSPPMAHQSYELPAPPPLRRLHGKGTTPSTNGSGTAFRLNQQSSVLASASSSSSAGFSGLSQGVFPQSIGANAAKLSTGANSNQKSSSSGQFLFDGSGCSSPTPSASSEDTSSSLLRKGGHGPATRPGRHIDFNLPAAKHMSTSEVLRLKSTREISRNSSVDSYNRTLSGDFRSSPSVADYARGLEETQRLMISGSSREYGSVFQPRGVSRSQMPEFVELRRISKGKGKAKAAQVASVTESQAVSGDAERAEERIRRRVEKLIAIHYSSAAGKTESQQDSRSTTASSSLISSLAPRSKFFATLRETSTKRSLEQSLVPWQPDDDVENCPICTKAFGGLGGRRKHHCRACGRVVCASPEVADTINSGKGSGNSLTLRGKCSGLVIRDDSVTSPRGGDGVSLAIKDQPLEIGLESLFLANDRSLDKSAAELTSPGFRICRDCRKIVMRGQYMDEENSLPLYVQLYDELSALQREIETSLPEFQELLMGLQKSDANSTSGTYEAALLPSPAPTIGSVNLLQLQRDAADARKQLLANFANYDLLAKKIRDTPDDGNMSLRRLKEAVWVKAGIFLQMNMFPLQSLPKFGSRSSQHGRSSSQASSTQTTSSGATEQVGQQEKSAQLAILQEQRDQIAAFLSRAQKGRKLNDAMVLRKNFEELEVEIARLTQPS